MRACGASSRRSSMWMSPCTWPLMMAWGTRMSPCTWPDSLKVNTASGPSPSTAPSMRPSRCSAPLKRRSPWITVPRAIRLVSWEVLLLVRSVLCLRLSMGIPWFGESAADGIGPGDRAADRIVARGLRADVHAIGAEIRRQHDGGVQFLEILEAKRQAILLRGVAERGPVQSHHLVGAQAFDADRGGAAGVV